MATVSVIILSVIDVKAVIIDHKSDGDRASDSNSDGDCDSSEADADDRKSNYGRSLSSFLYTGLGFFHRVRTSSSNLHPHGGGSEFSL